MRDIIIALSLMAAIGLGAGYKLKQDEQSAYDAKERAAILSAPPRLGSAELPDLPEIERDETWTVFVIAGGVVGAVAAALFAWQVVLAMIRTAARAARQGSRD